MTILFDRAQALFRDGRADEAVALVERAAGAGDAEGLFALGNWRLFAVHGPRDLAAAHDAFARAAAQGHVEATRIRAYLTAAGLGCDADPAAARAMLATDPEAGAQHALLDMPAPTWVREPVSEDPRIEWRRGLFSAAECRYLMAQAEPLLRPSFVVDPKSGARIPHPVRTSAGMNFGPTQQDLVISALNRRIAAATATEAGWGEPLHLLRYAPGQEYRPHLDALTGAGNQRRWTVLVYLNDGFGGGETEFPELDIAARGAIGDALVFDNANADGRPDRRTVHAGRPVTSGTKWLATRWIRERRHLPWEA